MLKKIYRSVLSEKLRDKIYLKRNNWLKKTSPEDVLFFLERKTIFIHIPKTAGISLYRGLFGLESFGHKTIRYYKKHIGGRQFRKCYKFTVVRNPYGRLLSAYNYLKKGGRGVQSDLDYKKCLDEVKSFEDFVINWLDKNKIKNIEHFRSQSYYLKDAKGRIEMDFIGRFENLNAAYKHLSEKLKVGLNLPFLNISDIGDKKEIMSFYTSDMIKVVNDVYKEDFENFNYKYFELL